MQVLWREVFEGDRPFTMEEFLFCYKPFEINQSHGFYQFTARGKDCRLIKSLVTSNRNWKTEFFFVFGFWSTHPVELGRDTFALYAGELGNLRPEAVGRSSLSKFHRDRIHRVRLHANWSFHSLVTLQHLATWGLGPEPSIEALAHKFTVRRWMATIQGVQSQPRPSVGEKRKSLSKGIDLGNLPSRRKEKKDKHRSSQPRVVKPSPPILPIQEPFVQILDVDSEPKEPSSVQILSTVNVPASSQPFQRVPQNLIENEDLAWERFEKVVTDKDVVACYDIS